jgi:peroxiredoxin/outer membrane lipoprotein-sorting protein
MIKSLFLSAALLTGAAALPPASAQTPPAQTPIIGVPALSQAKTIRVTETSYMTNRDHQFAPDMKMTVTFARPNCYRISATTLAPDAPQAKPNLFVTDGSRVTEYVAASNQYLARTVSNAPRFRLSQALVLDFHGMFNLLPNGFAEAFKQRPGVISTVTQTETQLDGQTTRLINLEATNAPDARTTAASERLWLASGTGLPVRFEMYIIKDGKERTIVRIDYTDWVIDKPVPPSTFAWTAPRTATAYPTDALLAVGTPAPDFAAITADGKVVHLSDFKGKPVVLDFWATWCVPCQAAMPHLEAVYRQVKDQSVVVLGVCVWDSKAAYQKWVVAKQGTYTFPTMFDTAGDAPSNIAVSKYAVHSIPAQYLIDKDGNIAAALGGSNTKNEPSLEAALARLGVTVTPETKSASR